MPATATATAGPVRMRAASATVPPVTGLPDDVGCDHGLRQALTVIDELGWDSAPGTAVLTYARLRVVRPQVRRAGLCGPAASQAEATGWAVAWELLSSRGLRAARSPWGVVGVAVRRAVLGEVVTAAYGTGLREAWRLAAGAHGSRSAGDQRGPRVGGLAVLDPERCGPVVPPAAEGIGATLELITTELVAAGWSRPEAVAVCEWVSCPGRFRQAESGAGPRGTPGWRNLARLLQIPPWRARRATVLLLGSGTWPGLVERVTREGSGVLQEPDVLAAVRSTVVASHLSPVGAAQRALQRRQRISAVGEQPANHRENPFPWLTDQVSK